MPKNPFLERTSVQILLGVVVIALFTNSATSHTDDGLPWEVTLGGFCIFAVVLCSYYAQKTEVALSICSIVAILVPTYYVHNYEVECSNWDLGSSFPLTAETSEVLNGVWRGSPNASRFDAFLPMDLSVFQMSLLSPGVAVVCNTSEIYHSGLKLDDPVTKERTYDYLLFKSPRKVRRRTETIAMLARVPAKFNVWPKHVEDYSFDLATSAQIVAPPTFTGEFVKLDKGPAIVAMQNRHNLRPFMLDVYRVEYTQGSMRSDY